MVRYRITIEVEPQNPNWVATQACAEGYARILCENTLYRSNAQLVSAEVIPTEEVSSEAVERPPCG